MSTERGAVQERLDAWLAWASRSRLKPFVKLARTIRQHKPGDTIALVVHRGDKDIDIYRENFRDLDEA